MGNCGCNEGRIYNLNLGCCVPVVANADNYYTKSEIDEKLEDIVESGCCITEEEVDDKIESAITELDLSDYAKKEELDDYATEDYVDSSVSGKQDTLIAGDGISISNNVISSYGGGETYQGSDTIKITDWNSIETKYRGYGNFEYIKAGDTSFLIFVTTNEGRAEFEVMGDEEPIRYEFIFHDDGFFECHSEDCESWHDYFDIFSHGDGVFECIPSTNVTAFGNSEVLFADDYPKGMGTTTDGIDAAFYEINELNGNKLDASAYTPTDLSNYYTKQQVENLIPTVPTSNSAFTNDMHYVTSGAVETQITNHFWCGTEQQWSQISGSTEPNTLYLIY